MQAPSAQR
jgi:hypothetical protein